MWNQAAQLCIIPIFFKAPQTHCSLYNFKLVFGLMEKDVLCATMAITVGVDLGFSWGVFLFGYLSYS